MAALRLNPLPVGIVAALLTFGIDQGFKYWMLDVYGIETQAGVRLAPFLDVIIAWNRGVSYSLFTADSDAGRIALLAVYAVAVLAFGIWMLRSTSALTSAALGMLMGGATGNALDRLRFGAVADFFHVHFAGFSPWGVFNLADIAIVAGVVLLLYESFFVRDEQT